VTSGEEIKVITDIGVAENVSKLMLDCGARLDESVALVGSKCSADEFAAYQQAVGKIMCDILFEVLNPLYKAHPSLKPPELYVP
jgi:hypothetical protein